MHKIPANRIVNASIPGAARPDGAELVRNISFAATATEQALHAIVELDPRDPVAYVRLGRLYHLQGRLDEAYAAYRLAWALRPREAAILYEIGTVLADAGDREQAKVALLDALELDPDRFEARARLARLYFEERDHETATRVLGDGIQRRYPEQGEN